MLHALRSTTLLLVALLVVACGGGASPAPTSDPTSTPSPSAAPSADPANPTPGTDLDACQIVVPADVEAATGETGIDPGELKEGPTVLSPARTVCTYAGDFGRLIVDLTPDDGANLYDAARKTAKDASDITIGGLGDGAFIATTNGRAFFWKGSVTILLVPHFNAGVEIRPTLEAIGKAALGRI